MMPGTHLFPAVDHVRRCLSSIDMSERFLGCMDHIAASTRVDQDAWPSNTPQRTCPFGEPALAEARIKSEGAEWRAAVLRRTRATSEPRRDRRVYGNLTWTVAGVRRLGNRSWERGSAWRKGSAGSMFVGQFRKDGTEDAGGRDRSTLSDALLDAAETRQTYRKRWHSRCRRCERMTT